MSERTLTDADVEAIVDKLKSELVSDFYGEVGRGVWVWVRKGLWVLLLALALYGIMDDKVALKNAAVAVGGGG